MIEVISPSVWHSGRWNPVRSIKPSQSPMASSPAAAWRGARLGTPGGDRFIGKPDDKVSALAQGRIIISPAGRPMPLFWDVVAGIGVGFKRQELGHSTLVSFGSGGAFGCFDVRRQGAAQGSV